MVLIPSDRCTGAEYVKLILGGALWDVYVELCEEKGAVLVMEDGAPIHQSKVTKVFTLKILWRLFPIQLSHQILTPLSICGKDSKPLSTDVPLALKMLMITLQEEWLKIDMDFINSLIDSMPCYVKAVIEAQGRSTKY